jgi:hypothetical protein
MNGKGISIFCVFSLVISGFVVLSLIPDSGLVSNVSAETWTETYDSDFLGGETTFVEIQDDTLQLSRGLNHLWNGVGEATNDWFGYSVSSAGDVNGDGFDDLLVGAYNNDDGGTNAGEVYVYYGSAEGPDPIPDWSAQGEALGNWFGYSVSSAGDVNGDDYDDIIVGAYGNDDGGTNAGEAYIYYGSPRGPSSTPVWSAQGEAADDWFGRLVSDAGDVNGDGYDDIIVGAPHNDSGGDDAGKVYVYYGSASGPSATPDWSTVGEATLDYFGSSASQAGDVNNDGYIDIIVGAYGNDDAGSSAGEAYIYYGSASGPGTSPDWSIQGEVSGDIFGWSVSGAGDVNDDGYDDIIIGAHGNDDGGTAAGKAYVYYGSEYGPNTATDWSELGNAAGDWFGRSVSGAGDVNGDGYDDVIVGAYGNDSAGSDAGEVYAYYGSASGPSATPDWSEQGNNAGDSFGFSVSNAGDVNGDGNDDLIIGAYQNDDSGSNAGKAYLFHIPIDLIYLSWQGQGEAGDDRFSYSLSSAGDVNGDGYDDIIVGAYNNDGAGTNAGEAYVYFGSATGLSTTPDWSDQGGESDDWFGLSVSGAGDVNSDGYDDIIVGAYGNNSGGSNAGMAYVYYGSANGPSSTPDWSDQGEAAFDQFGRRVSGAGDVNGDGYDDIIVGASNKDNGVLNSVGKIYVYNGSSSGLNATPGWSDFGEAEDDLLGWFVSDAGDVNGDGYDDILAGAPGNDGGGAEAGEVYAYYGSANGPSATPDWSDLGESAGDYFGYALSGAGDINDDGYDDIIVGAYNNDDGGTSAGEAYVYFGSATGLSTQPDWSDQGGDSGDSFGISVSSAGDINDDGYDDIIVGANGNGSSEISAGAALIYYGSANGPGNAHDWYGLGEAGGDYFGRSVSNAGDVDGDGYDDIIAGAERNDDGGTNAGKAYVYSMANYALRGRFISDTFSVEGVENFVWTSIDWRPFIQPTDTSVKFQIATNNGGSTWNFVGPDGTEDTFFTNPHGQDIYVGQLDRFIKVRIYLISTTGSKTPTITEFSVNYAQYEKPTIILTSPNGGEDWMRNKWYPITWNAEGVFDFEPIYLYYSTDNGANWTLIEQDVRNYGFYNWTVPDIETSNALILVRATDIYGNRVRDTSDATFAIDPPPPGAGGGSSGGGNSQFPPDELPGTEHEESGSDAGESNMPESIDPGIAIGVVILGIILTISIFFNLIFISRDKKRDKIKLENKRVNKPKIGARHEQKK